MITSPALCFSSLNHLPGFILILLLYIFWPPLFIFKSINLLGSVTAALLQNKNKYKQTIKHLYTFIFFLPIRKLLASLLFPSLKSLQYLFLKL